jgi:hypothetical protein
MTTVFRQILDTTPLAFRNQCWRADDRASRDETKTGRSVGA